MAGFTFVMLIKERDKGRKNSFKGLITKQRILPFFIWQAIVDGRLFLQRTFFLFAMKLAYGLLSLMTGLKIH